jgi:macrolide transport system ATP-binding/permease protein
MPMALIDLRDCSKTYHSGEIAVPVLQNVSLTIAHGEFAALMGASGSGKTTLMNILGCLDRPTGGQYWLEGREVGQLSADERALLRMGRIGFVFQTFNLLARTSALENVMLPLSYSAGHWSDTKARQRAQALLERMGLADRLHHEPARLSGGQQQRVAIARALINRPALLLADEPTGNLDSNTSDDVLRIFQRLNEEEGVTILLVTHDAAVARYARRVIRIRDGRIEAEGPGAASPETQVVPAPPTVSPREDQSGAGEPTGRFRGALHTALGGLRRNVLRAALTTLGIVIGVSAVIAMMELGRGSSSAIQRSIASLGANNLLVLPGTAASGGVSYGAGTVLTLTPEDSEAIASQSSAARAVAPIVRARTQVVYRDRNWVPIYIYGTTPAYLDIREWGLAEGDSFTERDVRNASKVCVIGQRLVRELFQGESPLEQEIRVENVSFKVIGVLSRKGANMMGIDQDDVLLAPWTTIKFRVTGSSLANPNQSASATAASGSGTSQPANTLSQLYPNVESNLYPPPPVTQATGTPLPVRFINVDQISVAARSTEQIPAAIDQITEILRERHRIHGDEPEDFSVRDMAEMTKALSTTTDMVTKLLLAVALISLVVGGVGIMNIMLVSVTERTREIGLRMAVGARRRNILQQFLLESVLLCFCGGIAGILLGRGVSHLITAVLQWPTELSLDAIIAAFAVSVTVGIVFGYYPAWKASRLDPITALRYE